jgi:formylglycine-generating enzyme required for sulfatase activity
VGREDERQRSGEECCNPNTSAAPTFYIPTENEWYKAAYFSPNYGGVGVPGYYDYATQSDTTPGNQIGSTANQANHFINLGSGFSVTQSSSYDASQNYLTDVGAFSGSGSFYGTFDQSGNVLEWNDLDGVTVPFRGYRGGAWSGGEVSSASAFLWESTSRERESIGFRLAAPVVVPEPSTYAMAVAGLACGGWHMFRRRLRHTGNG